jgi:hypothetical protein
MCKLKQRKQSRRSPQLLRRARLWLVAGISIAALGVALVLSGCGSMAPVLRALQRDTNSVSLRLGVMGNTLEYQRN